MRDSLKNKFQFYLRSKSLIYSNLIYNTQIYNVIVAALIGLYNGLFFLAEANTFY